MPIVEVKLEEASTFQTHIEEKNRPDKEKSFSFLDSGLQKCSTSDKSVKTPFKKYFVIAQCND